MSYQLQHHAPPSKVIYIDSRDAQPLTFRESDGMPLTSHFQYIFNTPIVIPSNVDTLISLHTASLPYSFYNIRQGVNDRLDFTIGEASDFNAIQYTSYIDVEEGNYSIGSLLDRLKIDLRNEIKRINELPSTPENPNAMEGKCEDPLFKFEYVKWKQKVILSFDSQSTHNLELIFKIATGVNKDRGIRTELGLQINDVQGFKMLNSGEQQASLPIYYSNISKPDDIYYHEKFLSPNCIDIQNSVRGIYVRTNLSTISTMDTLTGSYSSILCRVPIKVQSGGIIFYKPTEATHKALVKLPMIKAIQIKITDDRSRLLDFNGLNLQFSLQFDFVYSQKAIEPLTALESRQFTHYTDRDKEKLRKYYRQDKEDLPKSIENKPIKKVNYQN